MSRRTIEFQTIRSEGGLLPPDLFRRVVDSTGKLLGVEPGAYGLPAGERINEAVTQSWNRLRRHWTEFRAAAKSQPEGEAVTGLTNDKWSLPLLRELGFGFLATSAGPTIDGKTYAISRFAGNTAIHLVGCRVSLDRRAAGVRGAAQSNPHGLVQEFLNRSTAHLWAIVSNGLSFRILRDNQALSRQSFLEFDVEAMFDGEVYSDFVLLWLIAHATRFLPRNDGRPDSCWLEAWSKEAAEQGVAALTDLRGGVEKALEILGQGFVSHPKNTALREALRQGDVKLSDFHGQLLRVVYRLIFLFVAEDRELEGISLLHPQEKSEKARLARERYSTYYSTSRLRELASRIKGSHHGDLWRQFQLLVGALSGDERFVTMRDALALPSLGSMLWNPASTASLNGPGLGDPGTELANVDFLEALRHLAFIRKDKILRPVDYKNLGSEEFGGVYESFLALTPQISSDGVRFTFAEFAGNERKTSGSYYTPDSLVQCLLDSALDPVVQERLAGKIGKEAEKALLAMKVCDKAVGSGHFLVGAAHRLARHLARVRALAAGESEPSPLLYQTALRDVIGHCLYGVDINPMAVELCKVTLWLEALEPGKPLSFLDHHIRCGNSLLGATPELISAGLPDDAFDAIEGDDKEACSSLKKLNRAQREGLRHLFIAEDTTIRERMHQAAAAIDQMSDSRPEDIRRKEAAFRAAQSNYDFGKAWDLANLWCAAFVIKKRFPELAGQLTIGDSASAIASHVPIAIQAGLFGGVEESPKAKAQKTKGPRRADSESPVGITTQHLRDFVEGGELPEGLLAEAKRLANQYEFFHFHLAFPEVFPKGERGGFDVSLGNPPWERVKLQEEEWFAARRPSIANAAKASIRKHLIKQLHAEDPALFAEFQNALRDADGESHFMRNSGLYPLCGRGDINVYTIFAERTRILLSPKGCMGAVLPTGIATDNTTRFFFEEIVRSGCLISLFSFENEEKLFAGIHNELKFCLITLGGAERTVPQSDFVFFARNTADLRDSDRHFTLAPIDFWLLSPNTRNCPIFRNKSDASITKHLYGRVPVLLKDTESPENPWDIRFQRMFDMATDSARFLSAAELLETGRSRVGNRFQKDDDKFLPLYEGKMLWQFDHRSGSYDRQTQAQANKGLLPPSTLDEYANPDWSPTPRHWVTENEIIQRTSETWTKKWFLGWRDITNAVVTRTFIASILPPAAYGDTVLLMMPHAANAVQATCLVASLNSFVLDYVTRQKQGGAHLKYHIVKQLPVLPPSRYAEQCSWSEQNQSYRDWVLPRVLELTYTAWDLEAFAQDCGWSGPPFRWDEERRFLLRCELDAAFFHLYLGSEEEWRKQPAALTQAFPTPRDAVSYIMDTFPIVKRKDEARTEQKNAAGEVVEPGRYITKDTILEIYDEMAEAIRTDKPYQPRLHPPPADPSCCHPPKDLRA
jgi:hypothetical protein